MVNILIIDDELSVRKSMGIVLRHAGFAISEAASPEDAVSKMRDSEFSLIIMDMNFGRRTDGEQGIELLMKARILQPDTPVILITAWGTIDLAVRGMKEGAYDFITKPWNNRVMLQRIQTALSLNKQLEIFDQTEFDRCGIIGESKPLKEVLHTVKRIAPTDAPVLILGENGTGKEMIANAIHNNSRRRQGPMVMVNLGGISHGLFESEMFGHTKGAFTGAHAARKGRFEIADKGTIFLDEIGELDLSCQVKLLRVLQQHTFEPLGDSVARKVDIRIICATNADIPSMVRDKTFREDLFYRINLITINLPALRERRDDIPSLARHFIDNCCVQNGIEKKKITPDAIEMLTRLPYPGNIRQLRNMVERAVLSNASGILASSDFDFADMSEPNRSSVVTSSSLDDVERQAVIDALSRAGGNSTQAARILGITRQSLYRRKEKYGL